MDSKIPEMVKVEHPEVYGDYPGQEKHLSSENYPSASIQVHSQMKCGNIDEKLVKQELSDVLCEDKSERFSKLVDRAACSTIHEVTFQRETQEVIENGYNSSVKDENCHISENVSSTIKLNNELFLTNEKYQLQNVGTPLKRAEMPANPVDNIFGYDSCCPGRIQTEETPHMSDVCANVDINAQRHASSHTEQQACNCHDCGACSAETGCLAHHERKHARQGRHICDVCGAAFDQIKHLTRHKRKHTGEKPYTCDVCEASFAKSNYLTYHKRTHAEENPYKCDACEASFTHSNSLIYHKRKHTGEKPYKCDDCGASFASSSIFTRYKRTHTGEKPYTCDVCGACFARSDSLTCHKKTHTGGNPYKCDVCGESFTKSRQLKCHKRTHAKEKRDKCCTASLIQPQERKSTTCDDSGTSFVEACNLYAHDRKCSHVTIVARSLF